MKKGLLEALFLFLAVSIKVFIYFAITRVGV